MESPNPYEKYVEVTLEALAVAHLEDCATQLAAAPEQPMRLFLSGRSAHLALVSSLTAAVAGTASIGAFSKTTQIRWLQYFEDSRSGLTNQPTDDRVLGFKHLLRTARVESAGWLAEPLSIDMVDEFYLYRLTFLRDKTEHPRPEIHLIEPAWIANAVSVGARWAVHCLKSVWDRLQPDECERVLSYVESIEQRCQELRSGSDK